MIHIVYYVTIIKEDTAFTETTADMNTVSHRDRNNFTKLSAKLSLADSSSLSSEFGLLSSVKPELSNLWSRLRAADECP